MRTIVGPLAAAMLLVTGCCFTPAQMQALAGPRPEVVGMDSHDGMDGLSYYYWVDCTVRNDGAAGPVTVEARIERPGSFDTQRQTIQLAEGAQQTVNFRFGANMFDGQYEYRCSATR
ncbi:MAG: hypothetical protein ACK6CU_01775 [Deltaproteobacteria bacterium]|jgi:hypothetical protein